jgi:MoaA/NifB/PqqE/SkfB family radical SAM enzyme
LLDIDDIAIILKAMKTGNGSVSITTNGGKLWMDWWALEKYIDSVNLTFHFWQNPALMKYIVDTFKSKGKKFSITAPIRPTNVQEDIDRVLMLEDTIDMLVSKTQLYINGDSSIGMMNYSFDDLQKIDFFNLSKEGRIKFLEEQARRKTEAPPPPPVEKSALVKQAIYFKQTTWDDRYKDTYSQNPKYTGQLCNAGIECLYIEPNGWVTGSSCNNYPLGNIYQGFNPPGGPQKCGMIACVNKSDQLITKFPQPDQ